MTSVSLLVAAALAVAQAPPVEDETVARIGLPGESPRTTRRLAAADKLAAQEKWTEAVEEYARILSEAGDDLVVLDAHHSLSARRLCHLRLAALPPPALNLYRARVDRQAKKWLDQATAERDPRLLRRLVEETFCSRFADQALDLLGDLAFERGEFAEAERCWRMLAPTTANGSKDGLVYPDPQVDVARVQAKQLLARLFRGDQISTLTQDWRTFRDKYGQATGPFAGRKGNYAELLQGLLKDSEQRAGPSDIESWPTFAGDFARNRILPRAEGRLNRLPHLEGPDWTVHLQIAKAPPKEKKADGGQMLSPAAPSLPFYPLLVGDQVLVADGRYVSGFDLLTGERVLHYDLWAHTQNAEPSLAAKLLPEPDSSYTLTATKDLIYARLGAQTAGPHKSEPRDSYLVCIQWNSARGGVDPSRDAALERWRVKAQAPDGGPATFEGAPVVYRGVVHIAVTRSTGLQTQTSLVCFDAETGAQRWQCALCDTPEFKDEE
ncbi:MAG TPA: hypothetical protein VGZ25_03230, partial [Gemmataceae bacterium]|nr:hypothetical protein [Gemmataceae bacterium]